MWCYSVTLAMLGAPRSVISWLRRLRLNRYTAVAWRSTGDHRASQALNDDQWGPSSFRLQGGLHTRHSSPGQKSQLGPGLLTTLESGADWLLRPMCLLLYSFGGIYHACMSIRSRILPHAWGTFSPHPVLAALLNHLGWMTRRTNQAFCLLDQIPGRGECRKVNRCDILP